MAPSFSDIVEEARLSARALLDYGDSLLNPTVRPASPACRAPAKPCSSRRGPRPDPRRQVSGIRALCHRPDRPRPAGSRSRTMPVPRFAYENHVRTLIEERRWPSSTTDISELRLVIDYQRQNGADRTLTIDIVDYPGEWLWICRCSTRARAMVGREVCAVARRRRAKRRRRGTQHGEDAAARGSRGRTGDAHVKRCSSTIRARLPRRRSFRRGLCRPALPDAGQSADTPRDLCTLTSCRR